jgi:hypothetical protein
LGHTRRKSVPSLDSKRSHHVIRIVRAGFLDRDWRPDLRGSSDARAGPLDRRRRYRAARNRHCHGRAKYSAERPFLTRFHRGCCRLLLLERCGPCPYLVLCECYALRLPGAVGHKSHQSCITGHGPKHFGTSAFPLTGHMEPAEKHLSGNATYRDLGPTCYKLTCRLRRDIFESCLTSFPSERDK